MDTTLIDARRAVATLKGERGNEALVREKMIDFVTETVNEMNAALSRIPEILKEYGLQSYDCKEFQLSILEDGFDAVWLAVFNQTLARMEESGISYRMRRQLADENAEGIPQECKGKINNLVGEIKGRYMKILSEAYKPINPDALCFQNGKLSVMGEYLDGLEAKFTSTISSADRKAVDDLKAAAVVIDNCRKSGGVDLSIFARMARGETYTDAELFGMLKGICLRH